MCFEDLPRKSITETESELIEESNKWIICGIAQFEFKIDIQVSGPIQSQLKADGIDSFFDLKNGSILFCKDIR